MNRRGVFKSSRGLCFPFNCFNSCECGMYNLTAEEQTRVKREESCFSRLIRVVRPKRGRKQKTRLSSFTTKREEMECYSTIRRNSAKCDSLSSNAVITEHHPSIHCLPLNPRAGSRGGWSQSQLSTGKIIKEHKVSKSINVLSLLFDDLVEIEESDEIEESVATANHPVTHTLFVQSPDLVPSDRRNNNLYRSLSFPSLTQTSSAKCQNATKSLSLPDMKLYISYEEFTPDEECDDTYRFQCSHPGLYQCTVTGLMFHMEGEGEVLYRILTWNRRLLSQHHKKPAGPLFDIKCPQMSMSQLHLPHCEILSTGAGAFLSVAHVNDESAEFIKPHKITETHVIINITGFSAFGNVKDEDSPPDPVQALVLLFYKPPDDPDHEHLINVLMLPKNVSLRDVLQTRKKLVGDETYIETSPHCKVKPKQVYTLSTSPGADSVLVQPAEAEFDEESYDNYFPSFQVTYATAMTHIKLFLKDSSSHSVWERRVCLSTSAVKRSCGPTHVNLRPHDQLLEIRRNFIDRISGPVLQSLLDRLLEKKVINDSESEAAAEMKNRADKARCVIDIVRKKGETASSEMIEFLCDVDPFLCEHLGLM